MRAMLNSFTSSFDMRKFIRLVLSLVLTLVILNLVLYALVGDSENSRFYSYYNNLYELDKKHYSILITGDSHANDCWRHFNDSAVLDMTFPGDNQTDIEKKLKFLELNGYTYDIHLYEMDPQVLSSYRATTNNNDLSQYYNGSMTGIKVRSMLPLVFNPRIWSDVVSVFKPQLSEMDAISNESSTIDTTGMIDRSEIQFLNEKFSTSMYEVMKRNIETSVSHNAKIVMLNYPFYPEYIDLIDESQTYIVARDSLSDLIHEEGLQVLNFERLVCAPEYFFNQDHVNARGAEVVRMMVKKCLSDLGECEVEECYYDGNNEEAISTE